MDLMVKGFNDENEPYGGNDLLVYIKDNHPYIPIIIVTSVTDTKIKLESLFLGASYFMNRPQTGSSDQDLPSSEWDVFVEEISYYIWNILKGRRHLIEKEELSFAEDDIINSVLETSSPSAIGHQDVLGAKILIADDELHIRNAIREYLAQDGFSSIDLAENGQQAIEDFSAKRHDVVIVDIVMPKKNGIEVLKEIKARSPNSQVVIITGNADKDSAIAAVRLGAFDYVEKPFDFGALTRTVHKAIDKKILLDRRQLQG
jgi:DNA-binding NtrC family response regulator